MLVYNYEKGTSEQAVPTDFPKGVPFKDKYIVPLTSDVNYAAAPVDDKYSNVCGREHLFLGTYFFDVFIFIIKCKDVHKYVIPALAHQLRFRKCKKRQADIYHVPYAAIYSQKQKLLSCR